MDDSHYVYHIHIVAKLEIHIIITYDLGSRVGAKKAIWCSNFHFPKFLAACPLFVVLLFRACV
jgi:hypothetical protein